MTLLKMLQKYVSGVEIHVPDGRLIMRRFVLFDSSHLGLYIHQLCGRDHDALHNHPWRWSGALVISGWYAEERATATSVVRRRVVRAGGVNLISRKTFHRIDDVSPGGAWTIYLHGSRAQRDGFLAGQARQRTYHDARDVCFEVTRPISRNDP